MDARSSCRTVLLVNEDRTFVDFTGDALRAQGLTVLLTPCYEAAIEVLRSSLTPDAVLIDLTAGMSRVRPFLEAMREEPVWRALPVLGVVGSGAELVQLSPADQRRMLRRPSTPEGMRALLDGVCPGSGQAARELGVVAEGIPRVLETVLEAGAGSS